MFLQILSRTPHTLKLRVCAFACACANSSTCYNAPWDLKLDSEFLRALLAQTKDYISHGAPVITREVHAHLTTGLIARRQAELMTMFELSSS